MHSRHGLTMSRLCFTEFDRQRYFNGLSVLADRRLPHMLAHPYDQATALNARGRVGVLARLAMTLSSISYRRR